MIKVKKLVKSFRHSLIGLKEAFHREQNFRIMLALVLASLALVFWWPMEGWQKAAVIIAGSLMLAVELINTALEKAMDILLPASLEEIRILKDMMAGAALMVSVGWLMILVLSII
ncbi:hypothetical protein A2988_01285 [Candidatus Azambacteria bacterium RIFCSPLOWO2_01_FULL_46_25]|uniref:Diacylglycerol kinase n=1 Tax=Candidatus Azambacteria bacterium RIFCSPLOWO2_01_FULL_46_25 TaxID=1797298 RepID=A0A1F5BU10_9BACT|nr:MAG: hypothetical protein A2988_01285 [Candidatus Azambacteria bacterium RIFCSPLOWO2_01_FULL_46_25]OGD36698.1 MAG: hypothetical protein A2850_00240 [Candidatus Azambacteria bacterium RIFCSPHIGHO2_01_FULL_51_74]